MKMILKKRKVVCGILILMFFTCMSLHESKADGPESVELGSIAQYYDPVQFDHEMHVG